MTSIQRHDAPTVFLELSPHPVLATSIRECYESANSQPLILPTLKRKENEQITLLTSLAQLTTSPYVWEQYFHTRDIIPIVDNEQLFDDFPLYAFDLSSCWYESKNSVMTRLANRIPIHPLLGVRQLTGQTSATWKSLININLPQYAYLIDHKIEDTILFPAAAAYLEPVTAAYHQLFLSSDNKQSSIALKQIKFVKALGLSEHELTEVFTQIVVTVRGWFVYSRPWTSASSDCMRSSGMVRIDVLDSFTDPETLYQYSLREFTLHAHSHIEMDSVQQKLTTLLFTCPTYNTWSTTIPTSIYRVSVFYLRTLASTHTLKMVYVSQRTLNYCIPSNNGSLDPKEKERWKANYAHVRHDMMQTTGALLVDDTRNYPALSVTPKESDEVYESAWKKGGNAFTLPFTDLHINKEANETVSNFIKSKIRATVNDPTTTRLLLPYNYLFGIRRPCSGTDYYETFNRDNITLVDLRYRSIDEIQTIGVRVGNKTYKVDDIVLALGFDVCTGALLSIDIYGRSGKTLRGKWKKGWRTYLGLMIADCPNLFTISGPGAPSDLANMAPYIGQHVKWITKCLEYLRTHDINIIEPSLEEENTWVKHVNDVVEHPSQSTTGQIFLENHESLYLM
ncbi:unnamed protein product [Adineta steineri]|uniref:Polyketide synthase dehydratase domain-containing protein n=1 Tax=Adineta steineri TaxID=433720 RepID=A0A814ZCG7_9BILA|nr:unnamed protein product [Adineta steineri]CAF1529062.1 unnamed protein product [Adineta steineri]